MLSSELSVRSQRHDNIIKNHHSTGVHNAHVVQVIFG